MAHAEPDDTNAPLNYGRPGVLNTLPDSIQCHICGEWWTSLAAHAQQPTASPPTNTEPRSASRLYLVQRVVAPDRA